MTEPLSSDATRRALLAAVLARAAEDAGITKRPPTINGAATGRQRAQGPASDTLRSELLYFWGVMSLMFVGLALYTRIETPTNSAVMLAMGLVSFFIAGCYTESAYAAIWRLVRRVSKGTR